MQPPFTTLGHLHHVQRLVPLLQLLVLKHVHAWHAAGAAAGSSATSARARASRCCSRSAACCPSRCPRHGTARKARHACQLSQRHGERNHVGLACRHVGRQLRLHCIHDGLCERRPAAGHALLYSLASHLAHRQASHEGRLRLCWPATTRGARLLRLRGGGAARR